MSVVLYSYSAMRELLVNQGISPLKLYVNDMLWLYDDETVTKDYVGAIPSWINPQDPTHLKDQIHRNYLHGGGWIPFDGFVASLSYDNRFSIKYPGDPEYNEVARGMVYRKSVNDFDLVVVFRHSWVMIVEHDAVEYTTKKINHSKIHIARID